MLAHRTYRSIGNSYMFNEAVAFSSRSRGKDEPHSQHALAFDGIHNRACLGKFVS